MRVRNRRQPDIVALRQFLERRTLGAAAAGLRLLRVGEFRGAAMRCPRAFARLRPSAVRVRIRSRSTSASPPSTAIISRPVLVEVSAHGSASDRNCPPASTICLTMANRSKVERAKPVDPRHRHHVAGGERLQELEQLAPVGPRTGCLLAVNLGAPFGAQLLKLRVERLPVGADAGIAEAAGFRGGFGLGFQFRSGHMLRKT